MKIRLDAASLITDKVSDWGDVEDLQDRLCIYTTGSYGRGDASSHSDLDLFIVAREEDLTRKRLLSNLEEIELLASIVHVNRELELPEPDADGSFLTVHRLSDYLVGLGKPSDDADNTFTGRLLLLLESSPLFGGEFYHQAIDECVQRYWRDFSDHSESFLPAFLINDILRFWRTLCVNYEAGAETSPEKRRAKNYKLKHSRMLICYSAIIALQSEYKKSKTISPEVAGELLKLTPLDRLERSKFSISDKGCNYIDEAIKMYNTFLIETDCDKSALYNKMKSPEYYRDSLHSARLFGDKIFQAMQCIAENGSEGDHNWRFFRYITV